MEGDGGGGGEEEEEEEEEQEQEQQEEQQEEQEENKKKGKANILQRHNMSLLEVCFSFFFYYAEVVDRPKEKPVNSSRQCYNQACNQSYDVLSLHRPKREN